MNHEALAIAILTHPCQALLAAVLLGHVARSVVLRLASGKRGHVLRRFDTSVAAATTRAT